MRAAKEAHSLCNTCCRRGGGEGGSRVEGVVRLASSVEKKVCTVYFGEGRGERTENRLCQIAGTMSARAS